MLRVNFVSRVARSCRVDSRKLGPSLRSHPTSTSELTRVIYHAFSYPRNFRISAWDSVFSDDGRLMLTDVNPVSNSLATAVSDIDVEIIQTTDNNTPTNNQAGLQIDIESLEQFWEFS